MNSTGIKNSEFISCKFSALNQQTVLKVSHTKRFPINEAMLPKQASQPRLVGEKLLKLREGFKVYDDARGAP